MKFCKKCQTESERYADGRCKPCTRACNAAWQAAWQAANRGNVNRKAYSVVWGAVNRDKIKARKAACYAANPNKTKARQAAYRAANPGKVKDRSAAHYAANPDRMKEWRAANPEKVRAISANRRARIRNAGGKLSPDIALRLFKLQRGKCACCHVSIENGNHLDHVISLAAGGQNEDLNMQLLCGPCNMSKGAKHPIDFMQSRGFLL